MSYDNHRTSAAESINHLWKFSKSHLRFLHPGNVMPFLAARCAFIDIRSSIRNSTRKSEITANLFGGMLAYLSTVPVRDL